MKDFSWKYFSSTGNIDAYLLYKDMDADQEEWEMQQQEQSDYEEFSDSEN